MTAHVHTATSVGANSIPVIIESDMSKSLPGTTIVGLGAKSVDESKERIRSAIKNSQLKNPKGRVIINLSPADVKKSGTHFDLGMALSILLLSGQIPEASLRDTLVIGELGLDGTIKPAPGILGHLLSALEAGIKKALIPADSLQEASLVTGIELVACKSLNQVYKHLCDTAPIINPGINTDRSPISAEVDMSEVAGQTLAKRALVIAASGGHNLLMNGPPGGGKTMLAKALQGILPPLSKQQIIESTHLHSLVDTSRGVVAEAPLRSPHHSASNISMVGGGQNPVPGEISLAHNGILFLDELPEFSRQTLESLRQPLEDGVIHVSRISATASYPARCMLVATQNPCPCGYFGDMRSTCECSQQKIDAYKNKLSGPLLDRIDLHVTVERTEHKNLLHTSAGDRSSREIAAQVAEARRAQIRRQRKSNASLSSAELKKHAQLTEDAQKTLQLAAEKLNLSSRGFMRTIKIARTIADLEGNVKTEKNHILEALQFRREN